MLYAVKQAIINNTFLLIYVNKRLYSSIQNHVNNICTKCQNVLLRNAGVIKFNLMQANSFPRDAMQTLS